MVRAGRVGSVRAGRVVMVCVIVAAIGVVVGTAQRTATAGGTQESGAIGSTPTATTPTVAAGTYHTCSVAADGSVACWGGNEFGELGNDTNVGSSSPNAPVAVDLSSLGAGTTATAVGAGFRHTCALLNDGRVACWGGNDVGQVGTSTSSGSFDPTPPTAVDLSTLGAGTTAVEIAVGDFHTCAVLDDGRVACWGWNRFGQLGSLVNAGLETPNPTPVVVDLTGLGAGTTATAVAAGNAHTCAVLNDGGVACWGWNERGQLGKGSNLTNDPNPVPNAVDLSGLGAGTTATVVTAGRNHSCAVVDDGRVACWGGNFFNQLGTNVNTGTNIANFTPSAADFSGFGAGATATTVDAGSAHTCAVLNDGRLACWGWNLDGQLGPPTVPEFFSAVPPTVVDLTALGADTTATTITSGEQHTCAVTNDGRTACWGSDGFGQLGNATSAGSSDPNPTPRPVELPALATGAIAVAAGQRHTCALTSDGVVACWGRNRYGELSATTSLGTDDANPVPVAVDLDPLGPGTTAIALAAGQNHSCVLTNDGRVACWGWNIFGQLGNGTNVGVDLPNPTPAVVDLSVLGAGTTAIGITAGVSHTCALLNDGRVACWGRNAFGQVGSGATVDNAGNPTPTVVDLAGLGSGTTARAIVAGDDHTCAVTNDGRVACWGVNFRGQLGNATNVGTIDPNLAPAIVDLTSLGGDTTARAVAAGSEHTCALTNDGRIGCWGFNIRGQLGNPTNAGTTTASPTPLTADLAALGAGASATALAAGGRHTCVVTNDRRVACWGENRFGQLGNPTNVGILAANDVPTIVAVGANTTATAVAAGARHTCVVTNDGPVSCWGSNSTGQLASPDNAGTDVGNPTPNVVGAPTEVTALAAAAPEPASADLTWTAPPEPVFGPVTDWIVEQSDDAGATWHPSTIGGDTDPAGTTVSGLVDGTTYRFRVAAVNAVGAGPFADSNDVTPSTAPTVTVARATGQPDPTNASPIVFTVTFDQAVTGFDGPADVTLGGTAGASTVAIVPVSTSVYTVEVSGTTGDGTVTLRVRADAAGNANAQGNVASNTATVAYDTTAPTVTVALASGQSATTDTLPVAFRITFGEAAPGLTADDLVLGGTADPTAVSVSGGPTTYTATVADVAAAGTVTLRVKARVTADPAGNANAASNTATVTVTVDQGPGIVPLTPARLLETRSVPGAATVDGQQLGGGTVAAGTVYELPVAGRGGVPDDALTAMLNVTAVRPLAPGYLTVFPCGEPVPNASNVNYVAGQNVPNAVLTKIGDDGKVCIFTFAETHLLVDVSGYVPAGSDAFASLTPARLLETRSVPGAATVDGQQLGGGTVAAGTVYELPIAGRGGVPDDALTAMLNVTAVRPLAPGYLTVFPCGEPVPNASNVNYVAGQNVPNAVLTKIGDDGKVCIFTFAETHLLVDVSGYVPAESDGLASLTPARLLETRPGQTTDDGLNQPGARVAAGSITEVPTYGRGGVPDDVVAVVLNVTAVRPLAPGYLTVFPCGDPIPNASNVNYVAEQTVPNAVLAKVGDDGKVCIFSFAETHLLADVTAFVP